MYGLSAQTKKSGRCIEVAFSGGSTVIIFDSCFVLVKVVVVVFNHLLYFNATC